MLAAWYADLQNVDDDRLFRDPAAVFKIPYYAGAISNIGVCILCSTAAIAFFTRLLSEADRLVLALTVFLSCFMAFDDLFLLHEAKGLQVGLPGEVFKALYVVLALAIFAIIWRTRREHAVGLILAGSLMAASLIIDEFDFGPPLDVNLVEDTFKFTGYAAWLAIWMRFGYVTLTEQRNTPH